MTDPRARIRQLTPEECTTEALEVFSAMGGVSAGQTSASSAASLQNHVLRTFAQYPALTKLWLQFNGYLLSSAVALPLRMRQLAIQRVAWVRHCPYMWSSHLRVSLPIGLTREDFEAVKVGESDSHWSDFERSLISAVDRLVEESEMSDEKWAALQTEFDDQQMIELIFIVGGYTALTMVFNSLRIEREPELQSLAAEYGAPERLS